MFALPLFARPSLRVLPLFPVALGAQVRFSTLFGQTTRLLLGGRAFRREASLSLDEIRDLMEQLSQDQIRRVGRGEEPVHAFSLGSTAYMLKEPAAPIHAEEDPWFSKRRVRKEQPKAPKTPKTWMTAEIAEGLELRQRGHDPEDVKRMTRLAQKLMAWLEEEREREASR